MAENNKPSRLLEIWQTDKASIKAFVKEPLKEVENQLNKICEIWPYKDPNGQENLKTIKTLIDIIHFINDNRNLLIPKEYLKPSSLADRN